MTLASVAIAVGVLAMAVVAVVAALRSRRAEAALRASVEAQQAFVAQPAAADAARRARDEDARHAQVLEEVGRTADELAHGLKDLLTAITGRIELLIEGLDAAHPGRQDAYEIRRLALSAARLTKPLRALSASGSATALIDVNLVTSHTADAFTELLGADIEVSLRLDPGVMFVRTGASHVEEIVLNLAMRARAAMPGGGRLAISTTRHARGQATADPGAAREYVRLVVADTGAAMSAADREALFEPSLLLSGADGVAIGLARVCDIVKRAGGEIAVDSGPGSGTTFTVDLPAVAAPPPVHDPTLVRALAASVLVVEDEPRVRELIKVVLTRGGHDVIAVAGPHDALAALSRQPGIEVMLIDVVMPDMNGYDLATQSRALVPGLRVVFMSGFARDLTRHPPGDRFLAKPFAIESLHDVVQQALLDS
jgi:two-component system cell cycle sensor histidine kinase/response regulator CckA